jgi:amino acid transporter
MIQRIQSIYLLVATFLAGGLVWFVDFWKDSQNNSFSLLQALNSSNIVLLIIPLLFFASSLITLIAIFQFKNRNLQLLLGRISILINFILLGVFVYFSQNLSGETIVSEKGIGLLLPILLIVLVVLANRAIKRDEELVKSVDRLR